MPELYPDDQAKVDAYLKTNVNDVERKPFRPLLLLGFLLFVLSLLTGLAFLVARFRGLL